MDITFEVLSVIDTVTTLQKKEVADFLDSYLDDIQKSYDDILNALDYALSDRPHQGGIVINGRLNGKLVSSLILNKTSMSGFFPENIITYMATHKEYRKKGYATSTINEALLHVRGNIAVTMQPDNPAVEMFEKLGFANARLQMCLSK